MVSIHFENGRALLLDLPMGDIENAMCSLSIIDSGAKRLHYIVVKDQGKKYFINADKVGFIHEIL